MAKIKKFEKEDSKKTNSRINYKGNAIEFKDDDYETSSKILDSLTPYLEKDKIIYDPFSWF
jgi:hypothetical protein